MRPAATGPAGAPARATLSVPAIAAAAGPPTRVTEARLARVHLRVGMLPLARAALEQMAGAGTLDREALADLAEVRWRSGDLEGAAEAARAHLASGGAEPIAHLVVAEDLHRRGHEPQAHQHAAIVLAQVGAAIDLLFAGQPRASLWPLADDGWMDQRADVPGCCGILVGGAEVAAPNLQTWSAVPIGQGILRPSSSRQERFPLGPSDAAGPPGQLATHRPSSTTAAVMSGRAAGAELEAAELALAEGRVPAAAERLALLLRQDPALAPVILTMADGAASALPPASDGLAAIHVLRGDAFRILGRETEADAAFMHARQALSGGPPPKEAS